METKTESDCMKECTNVKQCKFFIHKAPDCYLGDFEAIKPLEPTQLEDLKSDIKIMLKDSKNNIPI